ncbi:MAG: formylmethanofuran--tetrahydromethanopterin N-formyltransferase, partial [Planctomycetales bacterium]|nr:formylmethanofuran--tetrahydromethanopterin N-formyltransferase [Planctomycetales bacterium]
MQINGIDIEDTFAEAFPMTATRLIITAADRFWALRAAESMTGFATSVIGCGCEAGVEREVSPERTPDGRPGIAVLLFSVSGKELEKQLVRRVGQCVLTCPSTSVFAGMEGDKKVALGSQLRYFGDGFQISKIVSGKRYWRIPVMDGEFVAEETTSRTSAIGGGNFLVLSESLGGALKSCEAAMDAMRQIPNVIMPFPGGVARSGSKVGSKYKALHASTNDAFCPTLRNVTKTLLPPGVGAALEVVIDGLNEADIARAMRVGILAACEIGGRYGLRGITGGNYGGKLGQFHFHLHEILK